VSATRLTPQDRLLRSVTEAEWSETVVALARLFGFQVAHFRPARTERGWRTPVSADGAGFPDLVMLHPDGRGFAVELKREQGTTDAAQDHWLELFRAAGFTAEVWRPRDRDRIVAMLSGGRATLASVPA
jgi:VRR-NUC domain